MRFFFLILFILSFGLIRTANGQEGSFEEKGEDSAFRDRLFVRLQLSNTERDPCTVLKSFFKESGYQDLITSCTDPFALKSHFLKGIREVQLSQPIQDQSFFSEIEAHESVDYIEFVPRNKLQYTPNDLHPNQWHLPHIAAENAWNISFGVDSIEVAIIDDAVLLNHQDLAGEIYVNSGEIPSNGIDDDGNGYVDDVNGWDAADNDNDPNPPSSATNSSFTHGTHVAGIACAGTDNGQGISSIGFGVDIMPVKIADDATASLSGALQGIEYAIAEDADVINMSWGSYTYSQTYQNILNVAHNKGIVMVAAAGNDNTSQYFYPASYNHVISVGATDASDTKASFSNYGAAVDVMAPGTDIYSSKAGSNSSYGFLQGTSMASPLVAGLAGLMLSENPYLSPDTLEECIKNGAIDIYGQNPSYSGDLGAGRIDAYNSLTCISPIYADFNSNLTRVCPGDSVHFFDQSTNNPTSWDWSFPGGSPSSSSAENPWVTYSSTGVYDVKLVVSNSLGTDSITYSNFITVAPPSGTLSGSTTIIYGNTAFLQLDLLGNPPWDITYTDGIDTFSVNNIGSTPYYLGVTPDSTTTYELLTVNDKYCQGSGIGTPTVTVKFGCNKGGNAFQSHIGSPSEYERGDDIVEAPNSDILIAGTTFQGSGNRDIYVSRYDSSGNILWAKTYGNSGDDWGRKVSIISDDNGNYYVGGRTRSYGNGRQLILFKIDGAGNILWQKHYGGGGNDDSRGLELTSDGGVVSVGSCTSGFNQGGSSDVVFVEFAPDGTMEWNKTYGRGGADHSTVVRRLNDEGFIIGFHQRSYGSGSQSAALTRIDSSGNILWERYYSETNTQAILGMKITPDSNLVGVGQHTGIFGGKDILVMKTDLSGNVIWSKVYGGNLLERGHGVVVDSNGNIYVSGVTESFGNSEQLFLLKLDPSGVQNWARLYGGSGDENMVKYGGGMIITSKGELALTGRTNSQTGENQTYFLKTNKCKNIGCSQNDTIFSEANVSLNEGVTNWNIGTGGTTNNTSLSTGTLSGTVDSVCTFSSPTITCALEADFEAFPVCIGDSTFFTDQSYDFTGNNIISWEWRFGDGDTIVGVQDPSHLYSTTDTFQVELIVGSLDTAGPCFDTIVKPVIVVDTLTAFLPDDDTICVGDSIQLGPPYLVCGAPSYDYSWSPSTFLSDDTVSAPIAAPDTTMEYVVEVTDSLGVVTRDTIRIVVDTTCCVSHAAFTGDSVYCLYDSVQFQDQSIVSGTSPTFNWNFGPFADPSSYVGPDPPPITYDTTGSFNVQLILTDSCGSDTSSSTVSVLPLPTAEAGKDSIVCVGDSVRVGDVPLAWHQYSWWPSIGISDSTLANPKVAVDTPITYYVKVTNGQSGCSTTDTIHIDTLGVPTPNLGPDTTVCQGDTVVLEASDYPVVIHEWQDGSTDSTFTTTSPGTYWVVDSNKCGTSSDTITIDHNAPPNPDLGPDTTICLADSLLLDASHPSSTYSWQDGSTDSTLYADTAGTYWVEVMDPYCPAASDTIEIDTLGPPTTDLGPDTTVCQGDTVILEASDYPVVIHEWQDGSTDSTFTTTGPGTYWVVDSNKCGTSSDTITIDHNAPPMPDLGPDTAICLHDSVLLDASHPNSTYLWQDGSTDSTLYADTAGIYWVEATDPYCPPVSDTMTVTNIPYPTVDLGNDTVVCYPDTLLLDATFPNATYLWQDGTTDSLQTVDTTGIYHVEVSNVCGVDNDTINVTMEIGPVPYIGPDTSLCPWDTVFLDATHSGATYEWQDGSTAPTYTVDTAGTYWVEVTDPPCPPVRDSMEASSLVVPSPVLGSDTTICSDEPIAFTIVSGPPDTVLWQDGTRSVTYEVKEPGTYTVYAANRCGSGSDTIKVDTVNCECEFRIPNVFTPNGDGVNDVFRVRTDDCGVNGMRIYNRWGQMVYRQVASDPEWDGRQASGVRVAEGTYYYVIRIEDETYKGSVILLRSE